MSNNNGSSRSSSNSTAASASSGSSSSSNNGSCTVDKILSDMTKSFSLCREDLFNYSALNWNLSFPTISSYNLTSSSTASGTSANNDVATPFWLASLDYLKTLKFTNIGTTVTKNAASSPTSGSAGGGTSSSASASSTSSSSSSSSLSGFDIYGRLGNLHSLPSQLLAESRIIASVEALVTDFISQKMQLTTAGIFFGAVVGAAVATGVMVGLAVATQAIGSIAAARSNSSLSLGGNLVSNNINWVYQTMTRFWKRGLTTRQQPSGTSSSTSTTATENSSRELPDDTCPGSEAAAVATTTTSVSSGPLVIIQGHPNSSNTPPQSSSSSAAAEAAAEDQCKSCLESIAINLRQYDLTWNHIRRVTAYLVSGKCDGSTFRRILQEFHHNNKETIKEDQTQEQGPLVSVLFVQQLENESDILQVEVIASR